MDLDTFLNEHGSAVTVGDIKPMYYLRIDGVECAGFVTTFYDLYQLKIMPLRINEDCGAGAGQAIYKNFKKTNMGIALKQFIAPTKKTGLPSIHLVNNFIEAFNKKLVNGECSLNTGLDKIQELSEADFEMAKNRASEIGYILTQLEDNYQTISYKLTEKN